MTDHDKCLVLRGISIARGILLTESCDHLETLTTYQRLLADAWAIDDGAAEHRAEFMALVGDRGRDRGQAPGLAAARGMAPAPQSLTAEFN